MADNWLDKYLEYVDDTEPPFSYHVWTGLTVLSAALGKHTYTEGVFGSRIFPNLYTILVGPSGCRKTTAMEYGRPFVKAAACTLLPNTVSGWQAFIHVMANRAKREESIPGLGVVETHSLVGLSGELRSFLDEDSKFLGALTDLYDAHDEWEYYTILRGGEGEDAMTWPNFVLEGCSAPEWIPKVIPPDLIGGGFTARFAWVVEQKRRRTNGDPFMDPELKTWLRADIKRVAAIRGRLTLSPEGKEALLAFYNEQSALIDAGDPPVTGSRFDTYNSRRHVLVLKTAMCLAVGRDSNKTILPEDITRAVEEVVRIEANMHWAFAGYGASANAFNQYRVTQLLATRPYRESEILRALEFDLDMAGLRAIKETLLMQRWIEVTNLEGGEQLWARKEQG